MTSRWQRALYQPNIPLGENGEKVTASKEHRDLSRNAAKEGMVLLKNDNQVLPLHKGAKVALFGKGSFDYVKGGGGSGDVTVAYVKNLYEGFKELEGQVQLFEALSDFYREDVKEQYRNGIDPGMTIEPSVSEELIAGARNFTDTAIITISRFSGEGWDRKSTYDQNEDREKDMAEPKRGEQFVKGDFYLTDAEITMEIGRAHV